MMLKLTKKELVYILIILLFSTFYRMWGITKQFEVWDETAVVRVGEIYLDAIKSGDFSKDTWKLNKEHPPFSKYIYGASRIISLNVPYLTDNLDQDYPIGRRYTLQKILSVLIGTISVLLVFLLSKKFFSFEVAVLSSLILSFTPYFIAHSRVPTQENMVAMLTLLSVYIFFIALDSNLLKNKKFIISGIILGMAIATKYNAFFYLILFGLLALVTYGKDFIKSKKLIFQNYIIFIPFISLLTFYVLWPWLWPDPIGRFLDSASRINESRYLEYFLGQFPSPHPWYYFFVYFTATTPPIILVGLILFIIKFIWNRTKYDLWFLLFFLTPFLATFSPLKMDGIRYIFTIYPALAIVTAVGYFWFINISKKYIVEKFHNILSFLIPIIVFFTLLFTAVIYHPYTWDYYNFIYGGPRGVYQNRLFDFGYWGEGLRAAMNYVYDAEADNQKRIYFKALPLHVLPFYRNNTKYTDVIEEADYVIINPAGEWLNETNYLDYDFPEHFDIVFEETLLDAPIVKVYKRNAPYTGKIIK